MRRILQCCVFFCIAVIAIALIWNTSDGKRTRRELNDTGSVIVEGDGSSSFAGQYGAAADLVAKGRLLEAESLYSELTNKEPNSPNAYVGLAGCRLAREDLMGARELYKKALGIEPRSVNALVGLGSSYFAESDYTNAAAHYASALAINEDSAEIHWGLAIAYAHLGRQAEAREHLDRFKKLAPDSRHITALENIVARSSGRPGVTPKETQPLR